MKTTREFRRQVLATLIKQNRRDLARKAVWHLVEADMYKLVGKTFWGKAAKVHFFNSSIRMEEIPEGARRGKQTSVMVLYLNSKDWRSLEGSAPAKIEKFVKAVKTEPFKRLAGMLVQIYNDMKAEGVRVDLDVNKQKAVHAPDSMQLELPEPAVNPKGVWIDMTGDAVSLRDTTDRNNDPSAFTQGPKAYRLALKLRAKWERLGFREILQFWIANRIKFHDYLAMD